MTHKSLLLQRRVEALEHELTNERAISAELRKVISLCRSCRVELKLRQQPPYTVFRPEPGHYVVTFRRARKKLNRRSS